MKRIPIIETETYSFGEWLKQRRERLRLTQRELAVNTHCSVPMIKKIEADERHPSPELAELLARTLKIPESEHAIFVEVARGERPVDVLWLVQDEAAAAPSLPFHAPVSLPGVATPFVGREDELQAIGERLTQPNCRLLTLVGPGGVGKTRLALAAARMQQKAFVDGVAFVSLAAMADANLIPDEVARSLRLTLTGSPPEQVLAYLRRRNMLLILDNCEQLEGDLSWLSDLLNHAPGVKLLATSRERLHLSEEWVYTVPGLAQAVDLFAATAQRVKQDFDVLAEKIAVTAICQLVENLPLAVELAASWTPFMPCAQIVDHIQRDIDILATDVRNIPDRHRSIQAVFDQSWKLLSGAEQNALMRLSVFRGGWEVAEALPVAEADLRLLRRLVDKSLVRAGENGRYDLHELIRQYASKKLSESGAETETRQRHFDAYLALAARFNVEQFSPQGMEAVIRFDQEQDNIRAALGWSLESEQTDAALHLMYYLYFYWSRRGFYHEGSEWAIRTIRQAGDLESVAMSMALGSASVYLFIQGRYGEAEPLALQSLRMARRLEDPEAVIYALGLYTFTSVNIEQALMGLEEAIVLIQETGKLKEMLPLFYQGAATWLHSSGRYDEARDYYWKSIALFRQMGAVDFVADPLGRLGQLALQAGRIQDAYDLTIESIAAARATGYYGTYSAWGGYRLAQIQLYMGDIEAAQQSLDEALRMFDDSRDTRIKQEALTLLSEVALLRDDIKAAVDYLAASLELCREFYRQLQATQKLGGTPDALPVDLIPLCSRAALVAMAQGHDERAVTLYSIADSFRAQSSQVMIPPLQAKLDETMITLRSRLSDEHFDTAWKTGQAMSLVEAFEFLLA
jgi:predicted ATPase/transcriptional regulator with XRE-family HTH domain